MRLFALCPLRPERVVAVEPHGRRVAALQVLEVHAGPVAGASYASDSGAEGLDRLGAEQRGGDERVPAVRGDLLAGKVHLGGAALGEGSRVGYVDGVRVDVDLHRGPAVRPVAVAEGVDDRLAEGLAGDLGNLLALDAPVDDQATADVGEDVGLRAADELVGRAVVLLEVEDVHAAVVGEDPGLEARARARRAEEHGRRVGERSVGRDKAKAPEHLSSVRVRGFYASAGVSLLDEPAQRALIHVGQRTA